MTEQISIPENERPQVTNLSQVDVENVKAELVRMHQSSAEVITAEDVELSQSASLETNSAIVNTRQSALGLVQVNKVTMQKSAATVVRAKRISMNGQAGVVVAGTSKLTFSAVKGQTYQIVVDGYQGESGSIKLALDQPAGRKLSASKSTLVATSQSANAIVSGSVTSDRQSHRAAIRQQHRSARWQAATNRADSSASSSRVPARSSVTTDVDAVSAGCLGSLLDN